MQVNMQLADSHGPQTPCRTLSVESLSPVLPGMVSTRLWLLNPEAPYPISGLTLNRGIMESYPSFDPHRFLRPSIKVEILCLLDHDESTEVIV